MIAGLICPSYQGSLHGLYALADNPSREPYDSFYLYTIVYWSLYKENAMRHSESLVLSLRVLLSTASR
jgi:hypothetical protein